jgi:hypothetical protein
MMAFKIRNPITFLKRSTILAQIAEALGSALDVCGYVSISGIIVGRSQSPLRWVPTGIARSPTEFLVAECARFTLTRLVG